MVCVRCGFVFSKDASRETDYVVRKDGTARHRDPRPCRAHLLTLHLGEELGAHPPQSWLFLKEPRDLVRGRMDIRPKDWKQAGWMPLYHLEDRALACILYHSWCWPVCLPYAVQLAGTCPRVGREDDDDDELLKDQYKHYIPLRERDIARILNVDQGNLSRALKRLRDRKDIRVDEDKRFFPAAKLAECSVAERRAFYAQEVVEVDPELKGVPKACRGWLIRIKAECPEDVSTDIFRGVAGRCTTFRGG